MAENKWTKANRLTEVIKQRISEVIVGSAPGYMPDYLQKFYGPTFADKVEGDKIWVVWTTTRTGLDKEDLGAHIFATKDEAEDAVASMPVGTIYGDGHGFPTRFVDFLDSAPDPSYQVELLSAFFLGFDQESVHFVCYEALANAGVINQHDYRISQKVLDWLGPETIEKMTAAFGENWTAVGKLEYCVAHFPYSSLVGLAARLFYAQFVAYDDFAAGYITKEIQTIHAGMDSIATSSTEARKKAGQAGGIASASKRLARIEGFLTELEKLSELSSKVPEQMLLEIAWTNYRKANPDAPKSASVRRDYEVAMKCDPPYAERYARIFNKDA